MNNKGFRMARQILRADLVNFLLTCYEPFCMIKMQSECMKHKLGFESAEKLSNFVSEVFKMDCNPSDLMPDENEMCNDIIDNYKLLNGLLSLCTARGFTFSKEDVISFMNYEYHNNILLKMKFIEYLDFSTWVLFASKRIYTIKDTIPRCVEYQIWNAGSVKRVDTKLFRKTFIRIERDFWNIVSKRIKRSRSFEK